MITNSFRLMLLVLKNIWSRHKILEYLPSQTSLQEVFVICLYLTLVLIPGVFFLGLFIFFSIYRLVLLIYLRRQLKDKNIRLLNGRQAMGIAQPRKALVAAVAIVEGQLNIHHVRSVIANRIVQAKHVGEGVLHQRLHQYMFEKNGYWFYKVEHPFSIENHVFLYQESTVQSYVQLKEVLDTICNEPFMTNKSEWSVTVIPLSLRFPESNSEKGTKTTCVLIRLHESIQDGISILGDFLSAADDKILSFGSAHLNAEPCNPSWRVVEWIKAIAFLPKTLTQLFLHANSQFLYNFPMTNFKLIGYSSPIDFEVVQAIKRATGTKVRDILMAGLAASLRKHFIRRHGNTPCQMTSYCPMFSPFSQEWDDSLSPYNLPLLTCTPVQRLMLLEDMKQRDSLPDKIKIVFSIMKILMNRLPFGITKHLMSLIPMSCLMTNVAGPVQSISILDDYTLKDLALLIPHQPETGIAATFFTWEQKLQIGLTVDSSLVESRDDVDSILNDLTQELYELQEQTNNESFI